MAIHFGSSNDPSKLYPTDNIHMLRQSPPPYDDLDKASSPAWYNIAAWSKKKIAIVAAAIIAIIVVAVVVPVEEVKKNRYPDYSALDYSMVDNIYGTTFFDSFDYFTGYDPTSGFVHYLQEDQMLEYVSF